MKRTRKILALTVAMIMLLTSAAFAATVPADVAGKSYEEAVNALVEAGAITGDSDGLFHGEATLTRAQACIIIVKTIDPAAALVKGTATQSAGTNSFSDMRGYAWAEDYITYAVKYGIVKGYPDGTFKPGVEVSFDEMVTMLVRAAGYETSDMVWPTGYVAKAKEVGMTDKVAEPFPAKATKGIAAQMTFNCKDALKAAAPKEEAKPPQGTDKDKPATVPTAGGMTFNTGTFSADMKSFNGTTVASDVKVYTYGKQKDYSKTMTFSKNNADYREDTVYKYKNVKTPAWYKVENAKITEMILPGDVGFSGKAYGVVNQLVTAVNFDGVAVPGFETLTATNPITWYGQKNLSTSNITVSDAGELYEFNLVNGQVKGIATAGGITVNSKFKELTSGNWQTVHEYNREGIVRLDSANGSLVPMNDNASIYVWDADAKEYKQGSLSSIRAGKSVRLYSITDEDGIMADVAVVK